MPTRSRNPLVIPKATRSGRSVIKRVIYGQDDSPARSASPPSSRTSKQTRGGKNARPPPAVAQSKCLPPKEKVAAVTEAVEASSPCASSESACDSSGSDSGEAEEYDTSKGYNVPYDGASRKTLYTRWILVKAENRQKLKLSPQGE